MTTPSTDRHRWRAYWACVAVAALTILDLTKVNVALPSIEQAFSASSTELQLVVSGYVLTFGLALVPAGRIGDQRSRKAMFVVGLSIFTLSSVAAALAPTASVLLIARLVQGVGAGIQMPQVIGTVQELFQGEERGRAFGLFGATIGIATAFGPTLGGLAIALGGADDGWRWIFWMNVPLGLAALLAIVRLLPSGRRGSSEKLSLDPLGLLLFAITVIALMWPFLFTTGSPDDNPARWWLLVVFVIAAALFVWWERRYAASGRYPLVTMSLFRIGSYRNGTLLATAYFAGTPAMFLLTTLFLQDGLGLPAVFAGMTSIGFALASAASSWWGGLMVNRLGRPIVVLGVVIVLISVIGMVIATLVLSDDVVPWAVAAVMIVGGAGGGLVIAPNQTLALEDVPVAEGGLAGSVGQLGQRIGAAIGTAVALSLFYATIYRETDDEVQTVVYHDAYAIGMTSVAVLLAMALLAGVVDLAGRRRDDVLTAASE
ncbi:MFS transporter [Microbacterium sp. DT81.1]|uniref:MFS transporter n=1 Tax=Microbacterium sp. DT81.1 TaxID=3393413 RepID=UPI003CEFAE79